MSRVARGSAQLGALEQRIGRDGSVAAAERGVVDATPRGVVSMDAPRAEPEKTVALTNVVGGR